jgi:hypothetical protein
MKIKRKEIKGTGLGYKGTWAGIENGLRRI